MPFGDQDLGYLLGQDFGVQVVLGGVTVCGMHDDRTVSVLEGQVVAQQAEEETVLVRRGCFPALDQGAAIMVDGVPYVVRSWTHEDQSLTRLALGAR